MKEITNQETAAKIRLIRRFHTLLHRAGLDEEAKLDMLSAFDAESSVELSIAQLEVLCKFVETQLSSGENYKQRMRRRVIRAVCQMCETMQVRDWDEKSDDQRIAYAKAIVCRSAGVGAEMFNRIGTERLRSLSYAFEKQKRDMDKVVDEVKTLV